MPFVILTVILAPFIGGFFFGYWKGRRAELAIWEPILNRLADRDYELARAYMERELDSPHPVWHEPFTRKATNADEERIPW